MLTKALLTIDITPEATPGPYLGVTTDEVALTEISSVGNPQNKGYYIFPLIQSNFNNQQALVGVRRTLTIDLLGKVDYSWAYFPNSWTPYTSAQIVSTLSDGLVRGAFGDDAYVHKATLTLEAVPEPGTLAILASGAGLVTRRRLKAKASGN